jgi:hypothetical protein
MFREVSGFQIPDSKIPRFQDSKNRDSKFQGRELWDCVRFVVKWRHGNAVKP